MPPSISAAFKAGLTADLYEIEMGNGSLSYGRWALYANRLPFSYKSVLHEYLDAPARGSAGRAPLWHECALYL